MQNEVTFIIDEQGDALYLLTDAAKTLDFTECPPRLRASHVLPECIALRLVFRAVRALVSDTSRIAQWTRGWGCLWLVDTSPVGGGIIPLRWRNRAEAIDAEVEALNEYFINSDFQEKTL
jgi:hypothetical protein